MNEFSLPANLDVRARGYIQSLFGGLVPATDVIGTRLVHRLEHPDRVLELWRVSVGEPVWVNWTLSLTLPAGDQVAPVLISADGCWPHVVNESAVSTVLEAGIGLAWFNRLELAHDAPDARREGPVFERWPEQTFGALSVWAWGLHRCVDALLTTGRSRVGQVAVVGHSRGGKAAILAGATDARIGATVSHNSGTGGAASLQLTGEGSESLADLATRFPHWLGPEARQPQARQQIELCDSWPLLKAIAPRGLCLLQASDDLWANPEGTRHNAVRLRPVWEACQAGSHLQWLERTGGHAMTGLDWQRAAAFVRHVMPLPPD